MKKESFCNSLLRFKDREKFVYTKKPSLTYVMDYTESGWILDRFTFFIAFLNGFDFRHNVKHGGADLSDFSENYYSDINQEALGLFTLLSKVNPTSLVGLQPGMFLTNRKNTELGDFEDNCEDLGVYLGDGKVFEWFPSIEGDTYFPVVSFLPDYSSSTPPYKHVVNGIPYKKWESVWISDYIEGWKREKEEREWAF